MAAELLSGTSKRLAGHKAAILPACAELAVALALAHVGRNAFALTQELLYTPQMFVRVRTAKQTKANIQPNPLFLQIVLHYNKSTNACLFTLIASNSPSIVGVFESHNPGSTKADGPAVRTEE